MGACPVCRLIQVLDASTHRLRVDAVATLNEQRLAQAELNSYLSTTPLPFSQDAPAFDPEAFQLARERLEKAQAGNGQSAGTSRQAGPKWVATHGACHLRSG